MYTHIHVVSWLSLFEWETVCGLNKDWNKAKKNHGATLIASTCLFCSCTCMLVFVLVLDWHFSHYRTLLPICQTGEVMSLLVGRLFNSVSLCFCLCEFCYSVCNYFTLCAFLPTALMWQKMQAPWSIRLSIPLFPLYILNRLTVDLELLRVNRPWT